MAQQIEFYDPVVANVYAMPCERPRFPPAQRVIESDGLYPLGVEPGCSVLLVNSVLSEDEVDEYISQAAEVERVSGPSAYGHRKPRREVSYYAEGESPYRYSNVSHLARPYPHYVRTLAERLRALVPSVEAGVSEYTRMSHGVDIVYSSEFERGGSIGAHGDNEQRDWGLVLVYSLGQSRWMRVRHRASGAYTNVLMSHNSLLAMCGAAFQSAFTHQVDKLREGEAVGARLSLNVRYGLPQLG